jgi:succinate-semialdehyde dehydrogenase/glutarate-semialdehyde dehydrogenase
MPWNFPFWQVFRFAAPALMAGNAAVLKHAANVPQCALAIEDLFSQAGLPLHVFANLLIGKTRVVDVIRHPVIAAVTLTGSASAGKAVASVAGEALKKTVLELGGSDPYLILADADLDDAVEACVTARMVNSGQSCIAGKRFLVVEQHRSAFEERIVAEMRRQKMGNPLDEETDVGPLARRDLRDLLHRQVQTSVDCGAQCLLGGQVPTGHGVYYPPTVLTDVAPGMPAYEEELFGPVAAVIPVQDADEAVAKANDSPFGLGAAVFTRDTREGQRIAAEELEAGCCFVNTFVRSDPRLPFGGIKESGFGRELSRYGIREFVNVKTVYVK